MANDSGLACAEIEITPAMIEAGVVVLLEWQDSDQYSLPELSRSVLSAALRQRDRGAKGLA